MATLSYVYAEKVVWIDDLHVDGHPANHDLCGPHADRTKAPVGWELRDRRTPGASLRAVG